MASDYDKIKETIAVVLPDIAGHLEMDIFEVEYKPISTFTIGARIKDCFTVNITKKNDTIRSYSQQKIQTVIEDAILIGENDENFIDEYDFDLDINTRSMLSTQELIRNRLSDKSLIFKYHSVSCNDNSWNCTFYLISSESLIKEYLYISAIKTTLSLTFDWLTTYPDIPYDEIEHKWEFDNYFNEIENIKQTSVTNLLSQNKLPNKEDFVYLSSLTYERQVMHGYKLLFVDIIPTNIKVNFTPKPVKSLNTKIYNSDFYFSSENIRTIRKLLELTTEEDGLIIKKSMIIKSIIGITNVADCYNPIIVEFTNHMDWKIKECDATILHYKNGRYNICPNESGYDVTRNLKKYLPFCNGQQLSNMERIIKEASKQQHGTMLLFTNDAVKEASRLCRCNRGIWIQKKHLMSDLKIIEKITSIDGALIIDYDCVCYAIGAILDGNACEHTGSAERGARYNSACTYLANKTDPNNVFIAVVVSEDGTIDILSNKEQP